MRFTFRKSNFNKLRTLEPIVTVVGSIEAIMTFPQIIKIWQLRSALEFYLPTWLLYAFGSSLWLIYGIHIKNYPLIIVSILWLLAYCPMVLGIILFG
ncbi:MAG: hypothetical protein A3A97_03755 [Candidatus Terrybacteria bacterium RIFCSPLOWO2_01_FULL_40_23]|uniref:Uncharacterized protein n=1 Tax=Candidatus Terrybacteria bacterium RIFCSPLOWO2_01_FULL_40_23 TaxID=1802366 RepID=A0A1G2PRY4_9BACT|nr:MAG: hypothetical protein A3A97_03755 [Candidatus Terrybacteria bacterium RIFCSPLOWO2_01_FULL_40_23]